MNSMISYAECRTSRLYLGSCPERDVPRFSRTAMQCVLVELHAACLCL